MKSVLTIYAALLLMQEPPMRIRHGTISAWEKQQDRVIIAADSVVSNALTGKPDGTGCKIVALGQDPVFFYTGAL